MVNGKDKGKLFAMKVLKKATIVRKRKVMEHTLTERSVLEAIRDFPFLVTLHYAFQTNAKLHLIMGEFSCTKEYYHLSSCQDVDRVFFNNITLNEIDMRVW